MTAGTLRAPDHRASGHLRRPLRVAEVTATYPPYWGGTGNVCFHNARELARLGHEVRVITAAQPIRGYQDPPGASVQRLAPLFRVGNAPLLPGIASSLRNSDIVHLHYPFYFGAEAAALACWRYGIPYVVTYHQDVELSGWLKPVPAIHRLLLGRRILTGAARVLFTSTDYGRASHYADLLSNPGVACGELPNGVDIDHFRPRPGTKPSTSTGDFTILFVGGLDRAHYFKGVDVLLDAKCKLNHQTARLEIVGDGDLRPSYEQRARELGIFDSVKFLGRVSDDDLPARYADADVVVLPSTTRGEAFGMVLLEGMASGTPVIASNLPGVRTVVVDGETGLLGAPGDPFDLAQKLDLIFGNSALRNRMGLAGRLRAEEKYDWRGIGQKLEAICYEVLNERLHLA